MKVFYISESKVFGYWVVGGAANDENDTSIVSIVVGVGYCMWICVKCVKSAKCV